MARLPFDSRPLRVELAQPGQDVYHNRYEAGRRLARDLSKYRRRKTLLILAVSVQGVEVALPVAESLRAPLDLVISQLLPIPEQPQSSFGAVVEDVVVLDDGLLRLWGLGPEQVGHIAADVWDEARHRMQFLRGDRPPPDVRGRTVIVTDDGLAIGFPILAAIEWVLKRQPRDVIVAIPVAPRHEIERLIPLVSEVVCPIQRDTWSLSIAAFYGLWQVPSDEKIARLLRQPSDH